MGCLWVGWREGFLGRLLQGLPQGTETSCNSLCLQLHRCLRLSKHGTLNTDGVRLSLPAHYSLILKTAKDASLSNLTILPKATSAGKESPPAPVGTRPAPLQVALRPPGPSVNTWRGHVSSNEARRLFKGCVRMCTQRTFIESLLWANRRG